MYERVIEMLGRENQCRQVMEECAELIQAVNKMLRHPDEESVRDDLVFEMVDVTIMLEQLKEMFGVKYDEFFSCYRIKQARLFERVQDFEETRQSQTKTVKSGTEKADKFGKEEE